MATQRYALNKNKYLLDPEVERLNQILDSFMDTEPRNCLLLRLALETGARAQELLNLKLADLDPHGQTLLIKGLKGSNDRELPLRSGLFTQVLSLAQRPAENSLAKQKSPGIIFDISYHRLRQIWEHYRPIPKKFHSLRHTFAIRLYRKTKDLRLLQVALGHRNITNTMIYADYVYSQQELRKLIL